MYVSFDTFNNSSLDIYTGRLETHIKKLWN
jgi:hypothetical protein